MMNPETVRSLRSAIHAAERQIPAGDHSKVAEWERDMSAGTCCHLWEGHWNRVHSGLRRLSAAAMDNRRDAWRGVLTQFEADLKALTLEACEMGACLENS